MLIPYERHLMLSYLSNAAARSAGKLSARQWQHLRNTLESQHAAAKRVRADRTALRIRRLGREGPRRGGHRGGCAAPRFAA